MAEQPPNPRVGAIERVGPDGFIVEATDPDDPAFHGGKRLLPNFDHLLRFLAEQLQVTKAAGAVHGVGGGNGKAQFADNSLPEARS